MSKSTYNSEHWDLHIQPKGSIFQLHLDDIWRYRDLLIMFVKRDFIAQYKQTILGPIWHFIQPMLTTAMYLLVFGQIAKLPTDGVPPVLFYLSGVTIWNYFASCLNNTSNTFVANAGIFGKVYFPRLILPISVVISNLVRFGVQLCLLIIAMVYYGIIGDFKFQVGINILMMPLLVILMAGLGLGFGIIISSLTTKYRDFNVLIGFAVQLLMYATPIAYPLSFLEGKWFAKWIHFNPLSPVVEGFKQILFNSSDFSYLSILYPAAVMVVVLIIGAAMFSRVERTFMDTV